MSYLRRSDPVAPVSKRTTRDPRDVVLKIANTKCGYQCRFCMAVVDYEHAEIVKHLQSGAKSQHDQKLHRYLEAHRKAGHPLNNEELTALKATASDTAAHSAPVVQRRRSSLLRQSPAKRICNDSFANEEMTIFRANNHELTGVVRSQNETLHQMRVYIDQLTKERAEAEKQHRIEMEAKEGQILKLAQRLDDHESRLKVNRDCWIEMKGILQTVKQSIVELSAQVEKYSAQVDELNRHNMGELMETIVQIADQMDDAGEGNIAFYQEDEMPVLEETHDNNNNEIPVNQ